MRYRVTMKVLDFDTKEEAQEFLDKLSNTFLRMPEAKDLAATLVTEVSRTDVTGG